VRCNCSNGKLLCVDLERGNHVRRLHRADEWWRRHLYQRACEWVDLSADVQLGLQRIGRELVQRWYAFCGDVRRVEHACVLDVRQLFE